MPHTRDSVTASVDYNYASAPLSGSTILMSFSEHFASTVGSCCSDENKKMVFSFAVFVTRCAHMHARDTRTPVKNNEPARVVYKAAVSLSKPNMRVGRSQKRYATNAPPVGAPCSSGFVVKMRHTSMTITKAVRTRKGTGGC